MNKKIINELCERRNKLLEDGMELLQDVLKRNTDNIVGEIHSTEHTFHEFGFDPSDGELCELYLQGLDLSKKEKFFLEEINVFSEWEKRLEKRYEDFYEFDYNAYDINESSILMKLDITISLRGKNLSPVLTVINLCKEMGFNFKIEQSLKNRIDTEWKDNSDYIDKLQKILDETNKLNEENE